MIAIAIANGHQEIKFTWTSACWWIRKRRGPSKHLKKKEKDIVCLGLPNSIGFPQSSHTNEDKLVIKPILMAAN